MDPSAPGWYPDPTGRHERRYWSGIRWSRHVDDGGIRSDDPVDSLERSIPGRGMLRSAGQVPTSGSTPTVPVGGPPPPAFGRLANPEASPDVDELLSSDELGVLGQVIGDCGSQIPTATTVSPG